MKKIILSSIFICLCLAILAGITLSANAQDLKKVEVNGKYGFVNNKGKFIVQPQYDVVGNFNEGRAYVIHRTEETKDDGTYIHNHIAYIDKHEKIIIPFYEGGSYFYNYSSGLVAIQNGDSTYCSYKDKKGRTILSSDYFEKTGWINTMDAGCNSFHEGLLNVYKYTDDTYKIRISAYMNKKGEIVHSKKFDVPEEVEPLCDFDSFSEGMANFRVNWKYGFINKDFEEIIPPIYDFAYDFKDGLSLVEKEGKWFYIDKQGNFVKEHKQDY